MEEVNIDKLSQDKLNSLEIESWPIWEKEISEFEWYYSDTEKCYILEGEIEVKTEKVVYKIKPGDFVTFAKGLKCKWKITKAVRKHYNFI